MQWRTEDDKWQAMRMRASDFVEVSIAAAPADDNADDTGTDLAGVVEVAANASPRTMDAIRSVMQRRGDDRILWGYGLLHSLVIDERFRGRGYAKALIAHAEAVVANWGYRWLVLKVDVENVPARRLYHRCGYECVAQRERRFWRFWQPTVETLVKELRVSPVAMLALLLLTDRLHQSGHLDQLQQTLIG